MYAVAHIDYHILLSFAPFLYVLSLILSTLVLLVGQEINGSKRWLNLGPLSFQPSEFAKVAVILFLAWQIDRSRANTSGVWFMCRTMVSLLPIVALVGSNNLSTAIIILGIGVILIFVSNPKYLQFAGVGLFGAAFVAVFLASQSYRLERLKIWRDPEAYEKGFQTIQGLYAIGSGGLFGRGLGSSLQKLGFVPEAQNDMIFSIVCEELGLVGAAMLILLFALVIWRLAVIAMHSGDLAGSLLAAGIMGHLAIQVILNIAVVTNSIPNTGITLPFVSYGGTSELFLLAEFGIAFSVAGNRRRTAAYVNIKTIPRK
jgi:cell division protein FtsW